MDETADDAGYPLTRLDPQRSVIAPGGEEEERLPRIRQTGLARIASMGLLGVLVALRAASVAHAQPILVETEQTRLLGGDPWGNERWGTSVACSADGTRIVVGSGAVGARIFVRAEGDWVLEHEVQPGSRRDGMGRAVAMSADGRVAAVGASRRDRSGAVRVLVREDAGWRFDAELHSSAIRESDGFGWSVALTADGEHLFVGAPYAAVDGMGGAGRVMVFARRAIGWVELATIARSTPAPGDGFGVAVAVSADGSIALVGARTADLGGVRDAGVATVLALDADAHVTDRAELTRPETLSESLGASVALSADGTRALVGAPRATIDGSRNAGAAYLFERSDGRWVLRTRVAGTAPGGTLGGAVAIAADGAFAFVGAWRGSRVRVFVRTDTGWPEMTGLLTEPNGTSRSGFGTSVAVSSDGHHVVIGAPTEFAVGRMSGVAHAVTLEAPGAGPAHVAGEVAQPFDAAMRAELAAPHRTAAQDSEIELAGALTMAGGVLDVVGGVVLMFAGMLSNESCYTFILRTCTYRTDFGLVAAGAVLSGFGAALLIAGGAIFSQRQQGPMRPRFALVPTMGGALGTMSLSF